MRLISFCMSLFVSFACYRYIPWLAWRGERSATFSFKYWSEWRVVRELLFLFWVARCFVDYLTLESVSVNV